MPQERYNHQLETLQSIGIQLKDDELDILELFAQVQALSIMRITDMIKSTELEMAYKNIYYHIQQLRRKKLIEDIDVRRSRNNEKYLRLTNDGVYQLFLKRPYGILTDQLSVRKGQRPPISHLARFLKYYGNNLVFKLFLYPYFLGTMCQVKMKTDF